MLTQSQRQNLRRKAKRAYLKGVNQLAIAYAAWNTLDNDQQPSTAGDLDYDLMHEVIDFDQLCEDIISCTK